VESINDEIEKSITAQKLKSHLPMIALVISFTPFIFFLLTIVGYTFPDIFLLNLLHRFSETILLFSFYGNLFCFIGIIMGIIALCKGKKKIGKKGFVLSIIAILWSSVWIGVIGYIGWLMQSGRFP